MALMERARFQLSVAGLLGVVACIAVNVWLFRVGIFLGIVGLNVTKHLVIAYLCQVVGVDRHWREPGSAPLHVPSPALLPTSEPA
jgi:hypothetical protein